MATEHTQHPQQPHPNRRAVDRLELRVADGERLLAEHIKRMDAVESERGRFLAQELLEQLSRAVELMRARLEAEQRERTNNRHPLYYFIARRAADYARLHLQCNLDAARWRTASAILASHRCG